MKGGPLWYLAANHKPDGPHHQVLRWAGLIGSSKWIHSPPRKEAGVSLEICRMNNIVYEWKQIVYSLSSMFLLLLNQTKDSENRWMKSLLVNARHCFSSSLFSESPRIGSPGTFGLLWEIELFRNDEKCHGGMDGSVPFLLSDRRVLFIYSPTLFIQKSVRKGYD